MSDSSGKSRKVSAEDVKNGVFTSESSESESETEQMIESVIEKVEQQLSPAPEDPKKPSDEKTTEEESSSVLQPPSLPETDDEGKTAEKESPTSPTLPGASLPTSPILSRVSPPTSPTLPGASLPPPSESSTPSKEAENVENRQPSQSIPSEAIVTNVKERYPAGHDIRNRLEFSRETAKDTNFFKFQIREMDMDVSPALSHKISRIPILSAYVKKTIDDYKNNSIRGDVSFKIRYLRKKYLFLEKRRFYRQDGSYPHFGGR